MWFGRRGSLGIGANPACSGRSRRVAPTAAPTKVLVTGSTGHLGEALVRTLPLHGHEVVGIDMKPSPVTDHVGSIVDRAWATC